MNHCMNDGVLEKHLHALCDEKWTIQNDIISITHVVY
jgi:hypothetical protein